MENPVVVVQWLHATHRKPRGARRSSKNRGPAFREGHVVDGTGCGGWCQCFLGASLEDGVGTGQQASSPATSRQSSQAVLAAAKRTGRGLDAGYASLGIRAGWLGRSVGARHDPALVRCGLSSGIRAAVVAPMGLESAAAGAPRPRTKRSGHRPLASRLLAATKKRAWSAKLAWHFSAKVAICCNLCDGGLGRLAVARPCNTRGTDATESRRLPPSREAPTTTRLGLYYELLDHNARTGYFIQFVREVHDHLRRPIILVWDRLSAHRSAARQMLADGSAWLHLAWLPPYAHCPRQRSEGPAPNRQLATIARSPMQCRPSRPHFFAAPFKYVPSNFPHDHNNPRVTKSRYRGSATVSLLCPTVVANTFVPR
jgi:hypothetical protein